ncbi:MAG: insulinase family protein, partial [Candidatus Woesearchaeota archaeon]
MELQKYINKILLNYFMIKTKEFPNGFKVNILKKDNELIKFSLNIGAGFRYENLGNNGIAHYLEHI